MLARCSPAGLPPRRLGRRRAATGRPTGPPTGSSRARTRRRRAAGATARVVLLHSWPDATAEALPRLIDGLRADGAELVGLDGIDELRRAPPCWPSTAAASKTDAALLGRDGTAARGRPRGRRIVPPRRPRQVALRPGAAVADAASRAGAARRQRTGGRPGGVLPRRSRPPGRRAADAAGTSRRRAGGATCCSETTPSRCCAPAPIAAGAIGVVCGTGLNCAGVAPDGRTVRFPALGAISGDGGGGGDVAVAARGGGRPRPRRPRAADGPGARSCPAISACAGRWTWSRRCYLGRIRLRAAAAAGAGGDARRRRRRRGGRADRRPPGRRGGGRWCGRRCAACGWPGDARTWCSAAGSPAAQRALSPRRPRGGRGGGPGARVIDPSRAAGRGRGAARPRCDRGAAGGRHSSAARTLTDHHST